MVAFQMSSARPIIQHPSIVIFSKFKISSQIYEIPIKMYIFLKINTSQIYKNIGSTILSLHDMHIYVKTHLGTFVLLL